MAVISKDLGAVTAYAAAVNRGYTGTREEFETLMASYAYVGEQAAESATSAGRSATDASQSATDAETAKGTAQQAATDAQTAQASAQGYAQSAQQSAQSASQSAQSAELAKNTAVNAVDGFAAGAQQALDSVNQAGNNWKSLAQAQALDSEAYALGMRDGENVGNSDPAYHNNAKYYAQQGGASAQTATEAAQTATTKASEAQASAEAAAESARTLTIDRTLTQSGQAAGAKETGDEITSLKEGLSKVVVFGNQLYDKEVGYVNGYARSADGSLRGENTSTCTSWFKCKGGQTYWINLKASYIGFYSGEPEWVLNPDDGYKYPTNYISGYLLNETSPANQITAPNNAKYVGFSVGHDYTLDTIMVNVGDSALPYEEYTLGVLNPSLDVPQVESVKNAIGLSDTSTFDVMYIKGGKACCGKTSNDVTAYYAGVELTGVPTDLDVKWVWEKGTVSGTVAIILNSNGLYRVSCITNWSLHIAITSTLLQATLMGDRVGQHYYANLINQTINLSLDGETENTAHVTISGNTLIVTINGTQYTGTLSDSTYSLTDFIGKYFIFEHYCTGDRNSIAMPMFTKVEATGGDCERFRDLFNRPNGQLCTSPQGYVYRLFTNLSTYQNYEQSPPTNA